MLHNKFWQGFFALAPIILFFIAFIGYFIFIFSMISQMPELENSSGAPMGLFAGMGAFFVFMILAMLLGIGSLIFYIVHATQNPNLKENNMLIVWILLFVFISGIGQLIYWLVEIVGKRKEGSIENSNL
ncbi:MAG: hypothetical protein AB8B59_04230 [Maribacter sp.]